MFTGIVSGRGEILRIEDGPVRRVHVRAPYAAENLDLGASVCHDGVCLTLVEIAADGGGARYVVEVSPETLSRTTLAEWREGALCNLERALRAGDELGGHIVQGHVDGVGEVAVREDQDGWIRLEIDAPQPLSKFIAEKGSIAVDGVSLTVNSVEGRRFGLMIIPHTAAVTGLGMLKPGARVNLEVDVMARYAARLMEAEG